MLTFEEVRNPATVHASFRPTTRSLKDKQKSSSSNSAKLCKGEEQILVITH